MIKKMFGETKLGIASTILSIVGAICVGLGSIGGTLNGNAIMKETVAETTRNYISENNEETEE